MQKKVLIIIGVLLIAGLMGLSYNYFFGPEAVEGEKEVVIQVIIEDEDINESFTYHTDQDFLLDLLKEKEDELGAGFQSFDFGTMVTTMMDYEADSSKEFFHISINDQSAEVGPDAIPLQDGDKYNFELTEF